MLTRRQLLELEILDNKKAKLVLEMRQLKNREKEILMGKYAHDNCGSFISKASDNERSLFDKLPNTFREYQAVEIARQLGITENMATYYLLYFIGEQLMTKDEQGHYFKKCPTIQYYEKFHLPEGMEA